MQKKSRIPISRRMLRWVSTTTAGTLAVLVMFCGFFQTPLGVAQEIATGTSSRTLRKEVVRNLPYQQLNAETKAKIGDILQSPSLYRRLPVTAIEIDPEYLQFLVRYPETVVGIWELMGITQMQTKRVGPYSLKTDDGAGTTSDMELVYGSSDLHIYFGDGVYEGPFLRKQLHAQCVIILRTRPHAEINEGDIVDRGPDGIQKTACQMDVFLKLTNGTAGIIAKTISPIVGPTADHNFTESLKFLQRLNQTTVKNGPGVQQMTTRLEVDPHVAEKFSAVAGRVFLRGQQALMRPDASPQFNDGYGDDGYRGDVYRDSPSLSAQSSSAGSVSETKSYPASGNAFPQTPLYQQQSYLQRTYPYPLRGNGSVRSFEGINAGGTFGDSSTIDQAIFRSPFPR